MTDTVDTWTVPREWDGLTAVCVGGGESLTNKQVDRVIWARRLNRIRIIGVNNAYEKFRNSLDVLYAADFRWWSWHWGDVESLLCAKVTVDKAAKKEWPSLLYLEPTEEPITHTLEGFDPDPSHLRTGKNGGYQAIHLAAHYGAKRILLIGYDQKGGHWHEPHRVPQADIFDLCRRFWPTLATAMVERGIEVINCSPGSALETFPMANLEDVL